MTRARSRRWPAASSGPRRPKTSRSPPSAGTPPAPCCARRCCTPTDRVRTTCGWSAGTAIELARMFADGLGYRLVVEPGAARLFKAGLGRDATRPLRRQAGKPFTPRGLRAAVPDPRRAHPRQGPAAGRRAGGAGSLRGGGRRARRRPGRHRRPAGAARGVVPRWCELGVLHERDGDLEHWAEQRTASLLDVRRDRLALLVAAPLAGVEDPDELLDVAALPSAAGGARVAVRRRLVESPVLSTDELTDEQAEWWRRNRNREREWFRDRLGLELELRAEGAVAVDPEGELTDVEFPGAGSARQLALLRPRTAGRPRCGPAPGRPRCRRPGVAAGRSRAGRRRSSARCSPSAARGSSATTATTRPRRSPTPAPCSSLPGSSGSTRTERGSCTPPRPGTRCARRSPRARRGGQPSLFDEEEATVTGPVPLLARRRAQRLAVRRPGVRVRGRPAAAARGQRRRQVQDAGDAAAVRARRRQGSG